MIGRNPIGASRRARTPLAWAALVLAALGGVLVALGGDVPAWGQTEVSTGYRLTDEMRARLLKVSVHQHHLSG